MEQRAEEDVALGWALAQGFGRLSPLQTRARQRSGKEELGRLRGAADFERRETVRRRGRITADALEGLHGGPHGRRPCGSRKVKGRHEMGPAEGRRHGGAEGSGRWRWSLTGGSSLPAPEANGAWGGGAWARDGGLVALALLRAIMAAV